jgi:2-methylcitrate synthase
MSQAEASTTFKPKKSVALSGTPAGNTALCTVGHTGNDLHYRGYDIHDLAANCEYEEVAYLLVHGKLPNTVELTAYKATLGTLRSLPASLKQALEVLPPTTHPMDVLRTGVSVLGCVRPEALDHNREGAEAIADSLLACMGSMLLYWHHYARNGRRIDVEEGGDSIASHFLYLLHGEEPSPEWVAAMQTSLILYAEHEFNASTFTARVIAGTGSDMYSCITGAIGALKGPKHGGANEVALEIQNRYETPDLAEADIRSAWPNAKSSLASAIRCTPSAIRAAISSRTWRGPSLRRPEGRRSLPWPIALRLSCLTPSGCFPTWIGSAPWPITRWVFPSICSRRCS